MSCTVEARNVEQLEMLSYLSIVTLLISVTLIIQEELWDLRIMLASITLSPWTFEVPLMPIIPTVSLFPKIPMSILIGAVTPHGLW